MTDVVVWAIALAPIFILLFFFFSLFYFLLHKRKKANGSDKFSYQNNSRSLIRPKEGDR